MDNVDTQEAVQVSTVLPRQRKRSTKELSAEIEQGAASPAESTKRVVVLMCVMALAQSLLASPIVFTPSLKTTYASVLMKSVWKLLSSVRKYRSDISKEIRKLLSKGPERYYLEATAELAVLRPERK